MSIYLCVFVDNCTLCYDHINMNIVNHNSTHVIATPLNESSNIGICSTDFLNLLAQQNTVSINSQEMKQYDMMVASSDGNHDSVMSSHILVNTNIKQSIICFLIFICIDWLFSISRGTWVFDVSRSN